MSYKSNAGIMLILLLSLLLVSTVHAAHKLPAPDPGYWNGMDQVNHVNRQASNNGGCEAHIDRLETAWEQMLSMIDASSSALGKIVEAREEPNPQKAVREYEDWLRIIQPFKALFGNVANFKELQERAANVRQTYNWLFWRNRVQARERPRYWIVCNDDWIKYRPGTFRDPRDVGTPDQNKYTIASPNPYLRNRASFPKGAYYLPGMPNDRCLWWEEGISKPNEEHPFCKPGVSVTSIRGTGIIIWCDAAFDGSNLSMTQVEGFLQSDSKIDERIYSKTVAHQWFRELFNYCQELEGSESPAQMSWTESKTIANTDFKKAANTPQNLIYFATAMYWDTFYWGSGQAATMPESEPWNPHAPTSPFKKFKNKCKDLKDKCGQKLNFNPKGGNSGQSSANPHGRRSVRKRTNGKAKPLNDDSLGVQVSSDADCKSCGFEPKEAKPGLDAHDTEHIEPQAMPVDERKKVCNEHKSDCEERRACLAKVKEQGPRKEGPDACMESLKASGTLCNQCVF